MSMAPAQPKCCVNALGTISLAWKSKNPEDSLCGESEFQLYTDALYIAFYEAGVRNFKVGGYQKPKTCFGIQFAGNLEFTPAPNMPPADDNQRKKEMLEIIRKRAYALGDQFVQTARKAAESSG